MDNRPISCYLERPLMFVDWSCDNLVTAIGLAGYCLRMKHFAESWQEPAHRLLGQIQIITANYRFIDQFGNFSHQNLPARLNDIWLNKLCHENVTLVCDRFVRSVHLNFLDWKSFFLFESDFLRAAASPEVTKTLCIIILTSLPAIVVSIIFFLLLLYLYAVFYMFREKKLCKNTWPNKKQVEAHGNKASRVSSSTITK